jgi:alpha-D-ribose 1-methylphosphonate 5-triphosphate synthase subunit PhnG
MNAHVIAIDWSLIVTILLFVGNRMESTENLVAVHPAVVVLTEQRQRAHALVAKSPAKRVRALFDGLVEMPIFRSVRPTDIGLVMVRGRVGGSGGAFNLGELPVTRAAVRLSDGPVGVGYVAGRDHDHAELAALTDAMIQSSQWRDVVEDHVLATLEADYAHKRIEVGRKAAATKVDFFTMVRTRATA